MCGSTHTRYFLRNPVRRGRDTSPPSLSSLVLSPILPSYLHTYLPAYLPTDPVCDLPAYFLRLRHSPPLSVPLSSPARHLLRCQLCPPFLLFYFSTNCASALPSLARISTSRRISPHFFPSSHSLFSILFLGFRTSCGALRRHQIRASAGGQSFFLFGSCSCRKFLEVEDGRACVIAVVDCKVTSWCEGSSGAG